MKEKIWVDIPQGLDLNLFHPVLPVTDVPKSGTFPIQVFPEKVQTLIRVAGQTLHFPPDFLGASILYAVSLAIGNTVCVEIKKGWCEKGVLYLALVGRAGTNKSHPLSYALAPFFQQDKQAWKVYKNALTDFESAASLTATERLAAGLEKPCKPVLKKTLVSDFTPEALAEVHSQNPRGIGVYADELVSWIKNFNRYNKGSEEQFWLSNWSGKPVISDRKSSKIFIDQPFISVAGTIQNSVLAEMGQDKRSGNGFLDRILFVMPDNLQKPCWNREDMPPELTTWYHDLILRLLQISCPSDEHENLMPFTLPFEETALLRLYEWQAHNTSLCNHADSEALSSLYSKFDIYISRLALLLQLLCWAAFDLPFGTRIEANAVEGAIQLVEYFRRTGQKVHHLLAQEGPAEPASKREKILYQALPDTFTLQQGADIAARLEIPKIALRRFLQKTAFFHRLRHGEYEKIA